jgi:hypothetical protein
MQNTAVIYCHILMFEKEDTAVINHFIFLKLVPGEKKANITHILVQWVFRGQGIVYS